MKSKHLMLALCVASVAIAAQHVAAQIAPTGRESPSTLADGDLLKKLPNSMQYTITDPEGKPLSGIAYRVTFPSGITAQGETDEHGRTARFRTKSPERLRLAVKSSDAHVVVEPATAH